MKRGVYLCILLIVVSINFISAPNETIICYTSKDCLQPAITPWCDGSNACQSLTQCLNPGTPQSECKSVEECVNCVDIGYLGCKDGQCQKINCYKDSECGESFTKKYCKDFSVCTYESTYFCQDPGTVDSFCNIKKTPETCVPCSYGCQNSVCITEPTTSTCTDSDGMDFYQQGKTCTEINCESDRCVGNAITLIEYYCDNNQRTIQDYGCSNGCKDGACVTESTTIPGCVQKGNACCKGEICNGIACQQGQTLSFKGCDSNCAAIGTCQSTETIYEQVKCVFANSKTTQKCYLSEYNDKFYCSGIETCVMDVKGAKGDKMTWKSSCGGYAYTVLDGSNEYAKFDCSETTDNCQSTLCEDGSKTLCYKDERGYCVCSTCSAIIIKPICGNKICELNEGQICETTVEACEAGKECKVSQAKCYYGCEQDCKGIEGIEAKLNEKFKLQVSQTVKIIDYKSIKMIFRYLLTPSCEESTTNVEEVKQKLTGMAIAGESTSAKDDEISIIKCSNVGPMAQLEIINPEEMGNKILTLKTGEAKNIYDISVNFLEYDYVSGTGIFVVEDKPIICPENCKCDNEGYTLECRPEEKCEEGKILCPDGNCKEKCEGVSTEECDYGCFYNTKCLPIGVRVKGLYCSVDGTLTNQLKAEEACDNNFECSSNVCISGNCISEGFLKKVMNWFKKIFGGE